MNEKAAFIIMGIITVLGIATWIYLMYGMSAIKKLVINDVDLSKVADGTYTGSFHKGRWAYDIEVTVEGHKIVSIDNVKKGEDIFKEVNDPIKSEIIAKQTPKIDVVSGATMHTKAYGKAVENALSPR